VRNRPLKKVVIEQLKSIMPEAKDTNEAVMKLISELARHYGNALECYERLEKYENSKLIMILRKLKVIRI
jgi:hypothetical protein